MAKKIEITCKGSNYILIDDLKNFQGNLKELPDEDLTRLKNSILKHGFSFPVFIWENNILDGHQRIFATRQLIDDGYAIEKIPVVEIMAKGEKEAAEKLLYINSRYAKMTESGVYDFLDDNELRLDDLDNLAIDDIDFDEIFEINSMTEINEIDENEVREAEKIKRVMGGTKMRYQIKPVFYVDKIEIFEKAILKVGIKNYGNALIEICEFYLENKQEANFDEI